MNSGPKKAPSLRESQLKVAATVRAQLRGPNVAQPKTVSNSVTNKRPAPKVYRPQPVPLVLQRKVACQAQARGVVSAQQAGRSPIANGRSKPATTQPKTHGRSVVQRSEHQRGGQPPQQNFMPQWVPRPVPEVPRPPHPPFGGPYSLPPGIPYSPYAVPSSPYGFGYQPLPPLPFGSFPMPLMPPGGWFPRAPLPHGGQQPARPLHAPQQPVIHAPQQPVIHAPQQPQPQPLAGQPQPAQALQPPQPAQGAQPPPTLPAPGLPQAADAGPAAAGGPVPLADLRLAIVAALSADQPSEHIAPSLASAEAKRDATSFQKGIHSVLDSRHRAQVARAIYDKLSTAKKLKEIARKGEDAVYPRNQRFYIRFDTRYDGWEASASTDRESGRYIGWDEMYECHIRGCAIKDVNISLENRQWHVQFHFVPHRNHPIWA